MSVAVDERGLDEGSAAQKAFCGKTTMMLQSELTIPSFRTDRT
jgi:hypothetical protein